MRELSTSLVDQYLASIADAHSIPFASLLAAGAPTSNASAISGPVDVLQSGPVGSVAKVAGDSAQDELLKRFEALKRR